MKRLDVTALGELLIDFTNNGSSSQGNPVFEANPGGAPCNVLALLAKLGHSTAFIGKVGQDMFGDQLESAIRELGISAEGLVRDPEAFTTLAFVRNFPGGERAFSFCRNPGADMLLKPGELNTALLADCKIFHFGTLSMTHEGCRQATLEAVRRAKEAGALISFDPNLRENLWKSLEEAKEQVKKGLSLCDIVKISDNEVTWLTGEDGVEEAVSRFLSDYPVPLTLVSLGKEGSIACQAQKRVFVKAFPREAVEATGAGDTFCGSVLHFILEHGFREYTEEELTGMLSFANAAAGIVTTRRGALRVMPSMEEIKEALNAGGIRSCTGSPFPLSSAP